MCVCGGEKERMQQSSGRVCSVMMKKIPLNGRFKLNFSTDSNAEAVFMTFRQKKAEKSGNSKRTVGL